MAVTKLHPWTAPHGQTFHRLDAVARGVKALAEARSRAGVCAILGADVARALGARECRLLRIGPRGSLLSLDETGRERTYRPEPDGPIDRALRREAAVYHDGAGVVPREELLSLGARASLAVAPLRGGGKICGALLIGFDTPRDFGPAERGMIQTIADAASMAVDRADLDERLSAERRRALALEGRLREQTEVSSRLMAVAAHELRSPLAAIKVSAEALIEDPADAKARRDRYLATINGECDHLARLISDVLDLSRLEAGERAPRAARVGLAHLISATADALLPIARARQVEFELDVEPDLVVHADPDLLRRVFMNLVGNAIKYSPPSGRVRIHARGEDGTCVCSVQDDGPGIPPEDLPRVFERFFRGRYAEDQGVEGHGLGLAIAREIVELHGGSIWAESGESGGARLCFRIPRRPGSPRRGREGAPLRAA